MDCADIPFDLEAWRDVPVIEHRIATEADIENCVAAFHTGGTGRVVDAENLPALGEVQIADGSVVQIVIVQIESGSAGAMRVAGYRAADGSFAVALHDEIRIIAQSAD